MKTAVYTVLALTVASLGIGCSNLDRSRDLGDPKVPAKTLALQVCSNCHGVDGNSVSPNFPKLAGQQEDYIVAQLTYFRSHNRADPAGFEYMWGISKKLTDEQIKGLATYFSQQKAVPNVAGDPTIAARGKAIFETGIPDEGVAACSGCHGEAALGNGTFPRLADQHANYMIKQLHILKETDQRPAGAMMKPLIHGLMPADLVAVTTYLQGISSR
ncbi:MAG: c-type cytochrome [Thiobacillaceae bacterium]